MDLDADPVVDQIIVEDGGIAATLQPDPVPASGHRVSHEAVEIAGVKNAGDWVDAIDDAIRHCPTGATYRDCEELFAAQRVPVAVQTGIVRANMQREIRTQSVHHGIRALEYGVRGHIVPTKARDACAARTRRVPAIRGQEVATCCGRRQHDSHGKN